MIPRPEHTGKAPASAAGRILAKIKPYRNRRIFLCVWNYEGGGFEEITATGVGELASVLASDLTQARDHVEHETLRSGKIPKGHKLVKRHKPITRNGRARK